MMLFEQAAAAAAAAAASPRQQIVAQLRRSTGGLAVRLGCVLPPPPTSAVLSLGSGSLPVLELGRGKFFLMCQVRTCQVEAVFRRVEWVISTNTRQSSGVTCLGHFRSQVFPGVPATSAGCVAGAPASGRGLWAGRARGGARGAQAVAGAGAAHGAGGGGAACRRGHAGAAAHCHGAVQARPGRTEAGHTARGTQRTGGGGGGRRLEGGGGGGGGGGQAKAWVGGCPASGGMRACQRAWANVWWGAERCQSAHGGAWQCNSACVP
jgi:hypothetical protein